MAEETTDPTQVQKVIKEVQQTDKTPLEIRTDTGQVFKGTTDEIIAQMKKSVESGTSTIQQQNQQLEQLRTAQLPIQAPVSDDEKINATYWQKWQVSPMAAQNYLDSIRLGVPEEMVPNVLRGTLAQTQVNLQQQAGQDFQRRCPDFPETPEAIGLLVNTMKQRYPRPPADAGELADRLEVTYGQLVRQGAIVPADVPIARSSSSIPSLGPSVAQRPDIASMNEAEFRKLSPDKMKEVLERLQAQGVK